MNKNVQVRVTMDKWIAIDKPQQNEGRAHDMTSAPQFVRTQMTGRNRQRVDATEGMKQNEKAREVYYIEQTNSDEHQQQKQGEDDERKRTRDNIRRMIYERVNV